MNWPHLVIILVVSVVISPVLAGNVIYVDDDAPLGGDGLSWDTAYRFLQDGLSSAAAGTRNVEVRVAQGVYRPDRNDEHPEGTGDQIASFYLWHLTTLKGGFSGLGSGDPNAWDVDQYATILSGDLAGDDIEVDSPEELSGHVTRQENSLNLVTTLDRVIIDGIQMISAGTSIWSTSNYTNGANLLVQNCEFTWNSGGIYAPNTDDDSKEQMLRLENCRFALNNVADSVVVAGNLIADNCSFEKNVSSYGGVIACQGKLLSLRNCKFVDNSSGELGLIVDRNDHGEALLESCQFYGNKGLWGTVQRTTRAFRKAQVKNCLFSGNQGFNLFDVHDISLQNCTFANNGIQHGDSSLLVSHYSSGSKATVMNCIIWGSKTPPESSLPDYAEVSYSDLKVPWSGAGNLQVDPLFVDADGPDDIMGTEDDDLRLLPDSPCINRGVNNKVTADLLTDVAGRPRILGIVDMGAHEQGQVWHVDGGTGSDDHDGLTPSDSLKTLSNAVDLAASGDVVLVHPGLYTQHVNLTNKSISVRGLANPKGIATIESPNGAAFSVSVEEGFRAILENLTIRNSRIGVLVEQGNPILRNLTIVGNEYGIQADSNSVPLIKSCILWDNQKADLLECRAEYSCIERKTRLRVLAT